MIKSISLKNFKCYVDSGIIPFSRINVLTGLNGRGKSTVLQAILLLAQSISLDGIDKLSLCGRLYELGEFDDALNRGCTDDFLEFSVETDDLSDHSLNMALTRDNSDPSSAAFLNFSVDGKDRMIEEGLFSRGDESPLYSKDGHKLTVRVLGSTSDIAGLRAFRNLTYISADRRGPVNSQRYESSRSSFSLNPTGDNLLAVMDKMSKEQLRSVTSALSSIMHGGSLRLEQTEDNVNLYMDSSDGGALYKPTNVGYGYGYLLSVLVALELAENKSAFIIENPEAHLHPGAQTMLMNHIVTIAAKKNLQIFVETHSDHIINSLLVEVKKGEVPESDLSVLFFAKEDGSIAVMPLKVDKQGRISDAPKDFFDEIDKSLEILVGF